MGQPVIHCRYAGFRDDQSVYMARRAARTLRGL
jgi:hypothetical protein